MPRSKKAKVAQEVPEPVAQEQGPVGPSEKEILTELYQTMKTYGINSIGDVEVRLSRL